MRGGMSGLLGVVAAVVLTLLAVAAALPGPYAGFALDDIRRPVYRGNLRYKRNFYNIDMHESIENEFNKNMVNFASNRISRPKRDVNIESLRSDTLLGKRKVKEISPNHKSDGYDENWSLVSLASSISDQNHTRSLVTNFLTKSLQHLKTTPVINSIKSGSIMDKESLDNLILSHTQHGTKPIQMYPEGSPPNWHGNPFNPSVILIEDVHPSKLPKPPQGVNQIVNSWGAPSEVHGKPPHNHFHKPVQLYPKPVQNQPKPSVIKPAYGWQSSSSINNNAHHTQHGPVEVQPVYLQKPPSNEARPKPYKEIIPVHNYPVSIPGYQTGMVLTSPTTNYPLNNYFNNWNNPTVYKPPYNHIRPTRPVYEEPVSPPAQNVPSEPIYKPVYTFPKPTKPSDNKPPHSSPRPPEVHYHDPPIIHNSSYRPSVVITQASVFPVTKPAMRPPPPTIIVIDSVTDTPTPSPPPNVCGEVQVINNFSKEPQTGCSDVMILVNSPVGNTVSNDVSTGGVGGGIAGTLGGIAAVASSTTLLAGTAAAGGAVSAGAAASAAVAAAAAAGSAGAAAAVGAGGAAAAGAAAAAAGAAGSGASGGSTAVAPSNDPTPTSPVLHPLDDEEDDYDYDDTTSSPTLPSKPTPMPPSTSSVTTFFDYFIAFINTLPILGPISVSLWVILLGPLAFLMVGLIGVGTFLLPWIGPRILLGKRRRRRSSIRSYPVISKSAKRFERNLKLGLIDSFY